MKQAEREAEEVRGAVDRLLERAGLARPATPQQDSKAPPPIYVIGDHNVICCGGTYNNNPDGRCPKESPHL